MGRVKMLINLEILLQKPTLPLMKNLNEMESISVTDCKVQRKEG